LDDLRPKFEVAQLAASAASKPRNARIQYFPKDADGMRVGAALKDLGFQVSKGQGNPELRRQSTNAIFFGPDVKLEDLKVVAVALVKGGASLRVIRPIQRTAPDKGNLIEIGTTGSVGNNPPLTVEKIQSAKTLTDFS